MTMLTIETQPVPLHNDASGVVHVGGTRVTLETVITVFLNGDSAEEIVDEFPAISLADVYAVISFYLSHRVEVDQYLTAQSAQARQNRQEIERRFNQTGLRQRLLERKTAQGL